MDFATTNRLVEHLGKCLAILPDDKYLRQLYNKMLKNCDFFDDFDETYSNKHIGLMKTFISKIADLDTSKYDPNKLRKLDYPSHEFQYYFMEQMPQDLLKKRLFLYKNFSWTDNNPLFVVATEIINNEIKKFYNDNKISLHLKNK